MKKDLQTILAELVEYLLENEPESKQINIRVTMYKGVMCVDVNQDKSFVKGVGQELTPGWLRFDERHDRLIQQEKLGQISKTYILVDGKELVNA